MRKFCNWMMLACLAVVAPAAAKADFSQIPGVFTPTVYTVGPTSATVYQSVYDTGDILLGELRNFSVAYDNFSSVGTEGFVNNLTWIGKYLDPTPAPRATTFQVDIYADNGSNAPVNNLANPTPLYTVRVNAAEVSTGVIDGNGDEYFQYTASIPNVLLAADTKYWLSISGVQPYGDNAFGWAFSSVGDGTALGDFQPDLSTANVRSNIASDFAFSATIQAVPEPSSCLLLAGAIGTIGLRKWRARRKLAA